MDEDAVAAAKRRAAEHAAETVTDGAVVGLGTGSTAAYAIEALGAAVADGLEIRGVATSYQSRERAIEAGIPLVEPDAIQTIDVAIDGADQVAGLDAIKGGGAAHAREKIVDAAADRLLLVVDERKTTAVLSAPVPIEVLPAARSTVSQRLRAIGGEPTLRAATEKDGPVVTDNGNLVIDCAFGTIESPSELGRTLAAIPGVVAHGLFIGIATEVVIGSENGVEVRRS